MDDLAALLTAGDDAKVARTVAVILRNAESVVSAEEPALTEVGRSQFHLRTAARVLSQRADAEELAPVLDTVEDALCRVWDALDVVAYIRHLIESGAQDRHIRTLTGVSQSWLSRRRKDGSLPPKYLALTDAEVDKEVASVKNLLPAAGRHVVLGMLRSSGKALPHARVRASLKRVDPNGSRARRSRVVQRRVYTNRQPDNLWHVDSNHKLGELLGTVWSHGLCIVLHLDLSWCCPLALHICATTPRTYQSTTSS